MSGVSEETAAGRPPEVEAWLRALFEESPVAIGFSRDGIMLEANPAYLRLFGYDVTELRGRSLLEQIAPSQRGVVAARVAQRASGALPPNDYETRGLRKDGTEFAFEVRTARVVLPDGPLTIAFITDLSGRDAAVAALRASEERFRTLSVAASEGIILHVEGKVVLANDAAAAMCGYESESMVGVPVLDLIAPESHARALDNIRRGSNEPYEAYGRRKDGSIFPAEVHGRTLSLTVSSEGRPMRVAIIRDITERKKAEAEQRALAERVRHAQKLESLGMLAGGVAHDFNNILTVITNGVELVRHESNLGAASVAQLETIALAAERAADLCRQMLAYAGKAALAEEPVDLRAIVAEMSSMLEVTLAKKVTLERALASVPHILGDPTQIRQVVMNLVLNASEAIGDAMGTVRVATSSGFYDADTFVRSAAGGDPKAGNYVVLHVEDDGVGMDASTMAQMFDPFFTTKFVGRGLGMAAVLGIVRGHGGAIDVASAPQKGTRVRIFFPARPVETGASVARAPITMHGEGVVLVVDDERGVRTSTQLLLREYGYEVLVAADGVEAIEVTRREGARVGAVLLDLTMPRMGGIETLRELRRIAPEVPVVLTSGYGVAKGSSTEDTPNAVLAKPYTPEQLLGTLRRVMRERAP